VGGNVIVQDNGYRLDNTNVNVTGNWVNASSAPFEANYSSIVTFSPGANHSVTGTNAFSNLTFNDSTGVAGHTFTFEAGKTQTIEGTLILQGNATGNLNIVSSSSGIAALFDLGYSQTLGGRLTIDDIVPSKDMHTGANSSLGSNIGTTTQWLSP
jgi:hypothetical protein